MLDYQIEQKKTLAWENFIFQFSKILSWFLHTVAMLIGTFVKAFIDAIKLIFHTT